jgi:hypothetical protein
VCSGTVIDIVGGGVVKLFDRDLDLYKERGDKTGLLVEPVNLWSNIAFFAGALTAMPFCHGWADSILAVGMILVGLGSTVYHAFPNKFTLLWDTTSIVTWISFYVFVWAFYMMNYTLGSTLGIMAGFLILTGLFVKKYGNLLKHNADYVPVIVLLLVCGSAVLYKTGHSHLLVAGIFGTAALIFRILDHEVSIPCGTHFVWHILNGFLMTLLTIYVAVYVNV